VTCKRRPHADQCRRSARTQPPLFDAGRGSPQLAPQTVGPNTRLVTPLHIEKGTVIGGNCAIGPNVYIERDCRIGDGVIISNAVVLRETVVPDGTTVVDQVVS